MGNLSGAIVAFFIGNACPSGWVDIHVTVDFYTKAADPAHDRKLIEAVTCARPNDYNPLGPVEVKP